MKTYRIIHRGSNELAPDIEAASAQEACEKAGWLIGDCWVREKTGTLRDPHSDSGFRYSGWRDVTKAKQQCTTCTAGAINIYGVANVTDVEIMKEMSWLKEIWNNEGRPRFMSALDIWRAVIHLPIGGFAAWLISDDPVGGSIFAIGFLVYQVVEDWRIKDKGYKDIFGYLIGFGLVSTILH